MNRSDVWNDTACYDVVHGSAWASVNGGNGPAERVAVVCKGSFDVRSQRIRAHHIGASTAARNLPGGASKDTST